MSSARPRLGDARLVGRQLYYEQLSFWRNPFGAMFTVGFSLIFLVMLGLSGGSQRFGLLHVREVQYYVPGFAAYGVMSACFNLLAISLVVRRENGLLKRLRLSPLPAWILLLAIFLSSAVVSAVQVVLLLLVGRYGFGVHLPHDYGPFVLALAVGAVCFAAVGVGASTLVPNQDSAGPIVSITFFVLLFLSGLWFPLQPGSTLSKIAGWFPVGRLIQAMFAPFHLIPGASPWQWKDLGVIALWGLGGVIVALRRWQWEPRRG